MIEINGMAHVMLTTSDFPRARAFYGELLPFLGLRPVLDAEGWYDSLLFEDPDGVRLDLNFVPGKGLLTPGARMGGT